MIWKNQPLDKHLGRRKEEKKRDIQDACARPILANIMLFLSSSSLFFVAKESCHWVRAPGEDILYPESDSWPKT